MRRPALATVLAIGLIGGSTTAAQATPKKQIVYPVKITIKIKTTEYPPDSPWREVGINAGVPAVVTFGQITSPKPACVRDRSVIGLEESRGSTVVEEKRDTGIVSDTTGAWEGTPFPDLWNAYFSYREAIRRGEVKLRAKVTRRRLSQGRVCAEAISDYLKA